jgi:hypothetical protein
MTFFKVLCPTIYREREGEKILRKENLRVSVFWAKTPAQDL